MLKKSRRTDVLAPKPQPLTRAWSPARSDDGCTLTVGGLHGGVVVVVDGGPVVVVVEVEVDVLLVVVELVLVDVVDYGCGGLTNTAEDVPATVARALSVTVTVWLPDVWNRTAPGKVWRPASPAVNV